MVCDTFFKSKNLTFWQAAFTALNTVNKIVDPEARTKELQVNTTVEYN
jgi:hypothetical protein